MVITIIGSTGYIGKKLVAFYLKKGVELFLPTKNDVSVFNRDLGNVIYCAGYTADWVNYPHEMIKAHVSYVSEILKNSNFQHLTYLSSTRLYDDIEVGVATEGGALTLNPGKHRHLYDFSKALGECLCISTFPEKTAIARLSCVYGFDQDAPGFLSNILKFLASRPQILNIPSTGGLERDYIYIDDVVRILSEISESRLNGIVNVASGSNISNDEVGNILKNYQILLNFTQNESHKSLPICDITRLKNLNISPKSINDSIRDFLEKTC